MIIKQNAQIVKINPTETKGAKGFKVRKVVFTWTENNYPNYLTVDVLGDKADNFVNYNENENVIIDFAVGGRKWDSPDGTKYFNQVTLIGIEKYLTDHQKEIKANLDALLPPENKEDLPF